MAEQNFQVTFAQFGGHPRGSILPKWYIARTCNPKTLDADIAHLVDRSALRPTSQPVNVTLTVPEPKASGGDPMADLVRDNNTLRDELKRTALEAASNRELAAIHTGNLDSREKSLAELTDKAGYWQRRAEAADELIASKHEPEAAALREEIAELKAELEQATAPDEPAKKHKGKQLAAA